MGNVISWREPVLQNDWIIRSNVLYFNFKNLKDQNSSALLDFNPFYMVQECFSQFLKLSQFKKGDLTSWEEPILQNSWVIWSPILYFDFKILKDPKLFVIPYISMHST